MARKTTVCLLSDERVSAMVFESPRSRAPIVGRAEEAFTLPDALPADFDGEPLADVIARVVQRTGATPRNLMLVVPLHWCFAHVLTSSGRRASAETLAFDLEQFLPLPLEELTCAYRPLGSEHVLGAAIPTAPMLRLIGALSERGLEVASITPDAVAALDVEPKTPESAGVVILDRRWGRALVNGAAEGRTATALFARNGHAEGTAVIAQELERRGLAGTNATDAWTVLDLTPETTERQTQANEEDGNSGTATALRYRTDGEAIARAACGSVLDLRTGPLAGSGRHSEIVQLTEHCLVSTIALVLLWIGGWWLHGRALDRHLAAVRAQQSETYSRTLNVEIAPVGAAMRLASERIRLEGLTRARHEKGQDDATTEPRPLDLLRGIAAALPDDARVMLLDARLDHQQVTLRGRTTEHRGAERIVDAINQVEGITARPPRTTRLKTGGVEFSIIAVGDPRNG